MPFQKVSVVKSWMLLYLLVALASTALLPAQADSLSQPAPFFPRSAPVAPGPGISLELTAQRALHLGLPSIAAELYQKIVDDPATPPGVRNRAAIDLATALIQEDRFQEAYQALQKFTGLPTPALRLRQAMLAVRERRLDAAKGLIQTINPDELLAEGRPGDRGWYYFVRAQLADDSRQAQAFYQQAYEAAAAAGLEAQRAWFLLARERTRLMSGGVTDSQITAWKETIRKSSPGPQLYAAVSSLAVGYSLLGQRDEAIALLQTHLRDLPPPPAERLIRDEWQLLLGLIAGAEDGAGRTALRNLLQSSTDRDRLRIALLVLARGSRTGERRKEFGALLDQLIASPTPNPILEYLLLFRAQAAISENTNKDYAQADKDADRLLTEFPGSTLKAAAYGIRMESAWQQAFYRNAANYASRARAELPPGETHAQLGVLVAEAYFRAAEVGKSAADYRTSADAYGAALTEVPANVSAGNLMFQRVLASINAAQLDAGQLDGTAAMLDEMAGDPRLDVVNRWQAEWSLARAFQAADASARAYARVNRLLDNGAPVSGLTPDLRVSLAWLQARLSLENNEPARTLVLAEALAGSLDGVAPTLKAEIASNALLLQARAGFALKNSDRTIEPRERLKKLRADFPQSDAAVYSYIVEADAADASGLVRDAQQLVVDLADKFKKSEYAPYALYRAALYAERQGPDQRNYNDAYNWLERLVTTYPDSGLVFYARLKQGNLLRAMNDFGRARTLYEALVNQYKFPQYPDALSASLALADTEAALAASDPARAGNAAAIYQSLYDTQSAPLDLRAEAGHKLGLYRSKRENPERAYAIWSPMIEDFVRDDAKAAKLGANGRYWMSRTILELAWLQERLSKPREAYLLFDLILQKNLPGAMHAKEGLLRTGGKSAVVAPAP